MIGIENPKILIYFSSHRQLKEIELSSAFFNRTIFLKNHSEIMVHCDNDSLESDKVKEFIRYEAKTYLVRSRQTFPIFPNGVHNGFLKGLSTNFDFFQDYDFVIHLVPDCYIVDEMKIVDLINENLDSQINFIVDYHPEHNESTKFQFCCDFFIFKPKKIKNIFSEHCDMNVKVAENWLYSKIHEHEIKHLKICRGRESLEWNVDRYGLIHNHSLDKIESILK